MTDIGYITLENRERQRERRGERKRERCVKKFLMKLTCQMKLRLE